MARGIALQAVRAALAPRSAPYLPCHHLRTVGRRSFYTSPRPSSENIGGTARLPDAEPIPVQKPRDSVTINDILERRAKAGKLVAGVAAASNSDMFKAPVSYSVSKQLFQKNTKLIIILDRWKAKGEEMGPHVSLRFSLDRPTTNTPQIISPKRACSADHVSLNKQQGTSRSQVSFLSVAVSLVQSTFPSSPSA